MVAGLVEIGIASAALVLGIWLLGRARRWLHARLERTAFPPERLFPAAAADFHPFIVQAGKALVTVLWLAAVLMLLYPWLVYCLGRFPQTAAPAARLEAFLIALLVQLAEGALDALPGLVAVVIIFLIARWVTKLTAVFFDKIEAGAISVQAVERETARTTKLLLVVVIWLFAFVAAYPYIPGSETDAFKGLSVLLGLMVTLGSTGIINQVISGLFVVYSKSVKPTDYVRIGDMEGEVTEVGALATKLRTPRQEEITIPHSVLVGAATINYSRLAADHGMAVTTSITVGYDVPWRQVHALLQLAAARTPGLRREPAPRVIQRELSEVRVQYMLLAHLQDAGKRAAVLSELNARIQDAFNEFDTQLMSPNFEAQPERPVVVPKNRWYSAPATPDGALEEPGGNIESTPNRP
jgi:small-conductance mechanosensitive channel